jgi:hypothetical protein
MWGFKLVSQQNGFDGLGSEVLMLAATPELLLNCEMTRLGNFVSNHTRPAQLDDESAGTPQIVRRPGMFNTRPRRVGMVAVGVAAIVLSMGSKGGCSTEEGRTFPTTAQGPAEPAPAPIPAGGQKCQPPNSVRKEFYCPSGTWGSFSEDFGGRIGFVIRNSEGHTTYLKDLDQPVQRTFPTDVGCLVVSQSAPGAIPAISETSSC